MNWAILTEMVLVRPGVNDMTTLKILIKKSGKKQVDIAKRLYIGENRLSGYVRGIHIPDAIMACRIAKELNTTVERIWGDTYET